MPARGAVLRSRVATAMLSVVIALGVVGCVDGGRPPTTPTPTATIRNPDTGDLKNPVGAYADLQGFSCSPRKGVWAAKGRLLNAQKTAQTYFVMVSVVTKADSGVVGSAWRKITVKAGDSLEFSIDSVAKSSGQGLQCVPRVVRARA